MKKKVRDLELRAPVFFQPRFSVNMAIDTMVNKSTNILIISRDSETAEGVFTERDVMTAYVRNGMEVVGQPVSDMTISPAIACSPRTPIVDAVLMMERNRVRHLLVEQDATVVGVLEIVDLLHAVSDKLKYGDIS